MHSFKHGQYFFWPISIFVKLTLIFIKTKTSLYEKYNFLFAHSGLIKMCTGFFALMLSMCLHAQTQVTGTFANKEGTPLSGITVSVKGKSSGTATESNGSYTINAAVNDVLVFSSVGFASKEIKVKGAGVINVGMEERINGLEDVVVVGYGTQKKKDLTGSVAVVNVANAKKKATMILLKC